MTPKFFPPQTISWVPWSYSENLETIALPIPEFLVGKQTDLHTKHFVYTHKVPYIYRCGSVLCYVFHLVRSVLFSIRYFPSMWTDGTYAFTVFFSSEDHGWQNKLGGCLGEFFRQTILQV